MSSLELRGQARGSRSSARAFRSEHRARVPGHVARLGEEVAPRHPARGTELSWNRWSQRVAPTSAGVPNLGVGKGDAVAMLHSNCHEIYIVAMAVLMRRKPR